MKNRKGNLLMTLGLLLLLAAVALVGYNQWDSNRAGQEAEEALIALEQIRFQQRLNAQQTAAPVTEIPAADAPATSAPTVSATDAVFTNVPTATLAATDALLTQVPRGADTATAAPTTEAPVTHVPATQPPKSTATPASTATQPPKSTATPASTATQPPKSTATPASTATQPPKSTATPASTATQPPKSTATPASTATKRPTPTATPGQTDAPARTNTPIPTDAPTATDVPTDTPIPTDSPTPEPTATPTPMATGELYERVPGIEMPGETVNGHEYIGTLSIPSLGLELPVQRNWSYPNLSVSPCRYSGSAYSGEFVVIAHTYPTHFGTLNALSIGATVSFTDMDGNVFRYVVREKETLSPTDANDLAHSGYDLTLATCTLSGTKRLVVHCDRQK